jgi:hypothetical protein
MKIWKNFLPNAQSLGHVSSISPGPFFVNSKNDPRWSSIYFYKVNGEWLSINWDYFDVEFKFEVYGISVANLMAAPNSLVEVGNITYFSQIKFLLKTEWIRPTRFEEVPDGFETVIEESGSLSQVANTIISAATSLHGLIFTNGAEDAVLMITIDDAANYRLKASTDLAEISAMVRGGDLLTLSEILAWKPPG